MRLIDARYRIAAAYCAIEKLPNYADLAISFEFTPLSNGATDPIAV